MVPAESKKMMLRASICVLVDNPGELELAEAWIERNRPNLTYVSEVGGCGCCVVLWDVEGPKHVVSTLPTHLSSGSDWVTAGQR